MPEYTAICSKCEKEQDYRASVADRDRAIKLLRCCPGTIFTRRMYSSRTIPIIAFQPGLYDIGNDKGQQHFDTESQMHKAVDVYNREAATRGSSGIRLSREKG